MDYLDLLRPIVPDIRESQAFNINNVAEIFWLDSPEYHDLLEYCMAPPYDNFFTSWRMKIDFFPDDAEFPAGFVLKPVDIITHFRVMKPGDERLSGFLVDESGRQIVTERTVDFSPAAKWNLMVSVFTIVDNRISGNSQWLASLDDDGFLLAADDFRLVTYTGIDDMDAIPVTFVHVSAMALGLLNAENVDVIQMPKANKKRRAKKRDDWAGRWHRLKIKPLQPRVDYEESEPTGIRQARHKRRGHFRHYGYKGRGLLFGKYKKILWIEDYEAGDDELGIVDKDYEIEPK